MTKKSKRPLAMTLETLRQLTQSELQAIGGGTRIDRLPTRYDGGGAMAVQPG